MESERLLLRKWELSDAEALFSGLSNKEVAYDFGIEYEYTIEDARRFIEDAIINNKEKYAVLLKKENKVIGGCGLHNKQGKISGSIWIAKEYQNNGYGTEACVLLVQHCFGIYDVNEMENGFLEGNIASKRMQEKIGGMVKDQQSTSEKKTSKRELIKMVLSKDSFINSTESGCHNDI